MNKIMFWAGMAVVGITAILLLTVKADIPLSAMGFLGILLIGASQYRPLAKN